MTLVQHQRIFAALADSETRPRSPHVVSDLCSVLTERGHRVALCSLNHLTQSFSLAVDGVPICVRGGDPADNQATEVWYFVCNAARPSGFVRVNAAKTLWGAPFRFVKDGETVDPLANIAETWYDVWPKAPTSWQRFSTRHLKSKCTVSERCDLVYLDEHAFANAIEFVLSH